MKIYHVSLPGSDEQDSPTKTVNDKALALLIPWLNQMLASGERRAPCAGLSGLIPSQRERRRAQWRLAGDALEAACGLPPWIAVPGEDRGALSLRGRGGRGRMRDFLDFSAAHASGSPTATANRVVEPGASCRYRFDGASGVVWLAPRFTERHCFFVAAASERPTARHGFEIARHLVRP